MANDFDALLGLMEDLVRAWQEKKSADAANVPSGEFREDDLRAQRVSVARERLNQCLDRVEHEIRRHRVPKEG